VLGAVLLSAVVSAQNPDFSGTWILDTNRSSAIGGGTGGGGGGGGRGGGIGLGPAADRLTITQDATTLTVEERRGASSSRLVYALDGRKMVNTIPAGRNAGAPATSIGRRDKGRFVMTISAPFAPGRAGSVEYREVWSLEPDGSLVIETTISGQPNVRKSAYKK
jgi:hypothetical protein